MPAVARNVDCVCMFESSPEPEDTYFSVAGATGDGEARNDQALAGDKRPGGDCIG